MASGHAPLPAAREPALEAPAAAAKEEQLANHNGKTIPAERPGGPPVPPCRFVPAGTGTDMLNNRAYRIYSGRTSGLAA